MSQQERQSPGQAEPGKTGPFRVTGLRMAVIQFSSFVMNGQTTFVIRGENANDGVFLVTIPWQALQSDFDLATVALIETGDNLVMNLDGQVPTAGYVQVHRMHSIKVSTPMA